MCNLQSKKLSGQPLYVVAFLFEHWKLSENEGYMTRTRITQDGRDTLHSTSGQPLHYKILWLHWTRVEREREREREQQADNRYTTRFSGCIGHA